MSFLPRGGTGATVMSAGTTAQRRTPFKIGQFRYNTDLGSLEFYNGSAWTTQLTPLQTSVTGNAGTATALQTGRTFSVTGDATGTSAAFTGAANASIPLTFATVNSNVGTFNTVTVNAKGLVTAASNTSYQPLDGDLTAIAALAGTSGLARKTAADTWTLDTATYLTGNQTITLSGDISGSGTTAITGTLATVNSNVGTFGSSTLVPVVTVNAKGLVTAVSTVAVSGGTPGGSTTQIQYNNAGAFGGDANFTWNSSTNDLTLGGTDTGIVLNNITNEPGVQAAGRGRLYAKSIGGRVMPKWVGAAGIDFPLQPHIGVNRIALWQPAGNSTTIDAFGAAALTATGTATAANIAVTNIHTYMRRVEYLVTIASTSAVAGYRNATAMWGVGAPIAGQGGFHYICRWGPATGVATATNRAFVGMANSTAAPTDVEPSSITNIVGMGWDAADANIQIMHRGAGAVTKIDLGASFPVPTVDRTKMYELTLFALPGTTQSVSYRVVDLGTNATATGTITTNLPTTSTFLAPRGWMSVGGTSSVIGLALVSLYIETDY